MPDMFRTALLNEFLGHLMLEEVEPCHDISLLDDLVTAAQSGDVVAKELVVRNMIPMMAKYYRILKMGTVTPRDRDAKKFACMFLTDAKKSAAVRSKYMTSEANADLARVLAMVCDVFRSMSGQDIVQELVVALLVLIRRWKPEEETHFVGYVYNAYRYEIYRLTIRQMSNPLISGFYDVIPFEDDWDTEAGREDPEEIEEDIGRDWLEGLDCHHVFQSLSIKERAIVKMKYLDKMNDCEIAEAMGMHRNSVRKWRNSAEAKLRGEYAEEERAEDAEDDEM